MVLFRQQARDVYKRQVSAAAGKQRAAEHKRHQHCNDLGGRFHFVHLKIFFATEFHINVLRVFSACFSLILVNIYVKF